jgi:hypothetical protein
MKGSPLEVKMYTPEWAWEDEMDIVFTERKINLA